MNGYICITYCASKAAVKLDLVSLFDCDIAADSSVSRVDILPVLFERLKFTFHADVYFSRAIRVSLGNLHVD
jgi:hypothetical protein